MKSSRLAFVFAIAVAIVHNSFLVAQEKGNASDPAKPTAEKSNSPPSGQRLETPAPRNDAGNFDAVKGQIKATDEEWKVIGPKIRAVMSARRVADSGLNSGVQQNAMFGFAGGRGGPGAGFGGGGRGGFGGPGGGGPGGGGPGFGRDAFDAPGNNGGGPGGPGGRGGFGGARGGERRGPDVADGRRDNPGSDDREARRNDPQDGKGAPRENRGPNNPGDAPAPNGSPGGNVAIVRGVPDGGGPGFGGPGGGGPGGMGPGGNNFVSRALTELQTAAGDAKSSPEDLREKIAAVRTARTKAREELHAAQKELLLLITPTQEATLIGLGYLD